MPSPDDLDGALRAADPLAEMQLGTPQIETALNELGQHLLRIPTMASHNWWRTKRPRQTRRILAVALASFLVVGVAGATSVVLTARTGQQVPKKYVGAGGPGEELRTWAPDFCKVALSISSNIKYPASDENWRLQVLIFENRIPSPSTTGPCPVTPPGGTPAAQQVEVSTGAERGWFAMSAFCAWVSDYAQAKKSGNTSEDSKAASEVASALTWPAVRAELSHPVKWSAFGWFLRFQRLVANGDASKVMHKLALPHNSCAQFVPKS
jgi:hypothetical protein